MHGPCMGRPSKNQSGRIGWTIHEITRARLAPITHDRSPRFYLTVAASQWGFLAVLGQTIHKVCSHRYTFAAVYSARPYTPAELGILLRDGHSERLMIKIIGEVMKLAPVTANYAPVML